MFKYLSVIPLVAVLIYSPAKAQENETLEIAVEYYDFISDTMAFGNVIGNYCSEHVEGDTEAASLAKQSAQTIMYVINSSLPPFKKNPIITSTQNKIVDFEEMVNNTSGCRIEDYRMISGILDDIKLAVDRAEES
ncbi:MULTISPECIES: hypothetical protein [Gammaproteobacteria]|uniref:hypothetical protein n=1 Tax=Gammaproteobacteria TaxID=1236 RepID=UPI000DD0A4B7|nr:MULTISPECIES: hypothetical protein [Gammaproteobacteria]RTE86531.1 hypothetical protein DQX04_08215 [Aliidiomarina sp. B3213]TCZ90914.1 hypothetical protein EYQ95_08830 [Lysobacter sp. N42]